MTATENVERIDIIEGPNMAGLFKPTLLAEAFEESGSKIDDVQLSFDLVKLFPKEGESLDEFFAEISILRGYLIGWRPLGEALFRNHDFIIKVISGFGTFEGSYNTHSRKGSLARVR